MTNDSAPTNDRGPASFWAVVGAATLVAITLGVGTGVLLAKIAPEDKFSWLGLLLAPLWLLLEFVFELLVGVYNLHSKAARTAGIAGLLLSFYATWFVMRPL